ncbi:Regulator of chromosome condensation 1/beta-lactamase-inhibitor protein II [Phytophthora cactorum]|nr:Regulator of chromosome condensation 1/beta-lactamase-inhibitor protein II [Phytophthora cactorum]
MTPTTAFEQRDALVVSATFLRTAFGGASSAYSLWLGQPCTSVVVVHLLLPSDAIGSVRLSSDRLCFTPDTFAQPQIVRVEALENRQQWSVITHRLYSLDRNYDRVVTPNVVVQTEVTPLECPLLTFGGLTTKRKAATTDSSTRLDILAALPKDTTNEAAEGGAAVDASWCMSHLASGYHFSVAAVVQPKGTTLLSWGLNTNGELGNGTMTSSPTPQQVITLPLQLQREPLTLPMFPRLFTWGCNKYGQLGLGDFSPRTQPHEVYFALATLSSHRRALRVMHTVQRAGNNVTHVACGAAHTLFVTHQQQILGMGYNQAGQLGLGHRLQQHKGWRSCTPIAVESLRDQSILDLAAGQNHSACALSNGDVYTWGCGDDGRLGDGKLGEGVATPTLIKLLREVSVRARSVRCGARHMAVISDCDLLYIWGANDFGQLGCKDNRPRSRPFLLAAPSLFTEGVEDVALGEFHTTCVTCAGKAYTWGLNLRDNNALKERVRRISCGWTHTNIVTYISADEASVSGQGANFDRKIERERINQRKAEVARWRAFVTAAISSTSRETRRGDREQKSPIQKAVKTTKNVKSTAKGIAEQTEAVQEIEASLEKLSVSYSNQAMEDASTADSISANEERYRVDMEQLTSSNDKFLEISTSANQHLEQMHSQLPTISDAFDQAALSTDIATLHEQHASAKNDMANRFEAAMNNNAEEMVSLSEALANEKAGLVEAHARELEIADQAFREKTEVLEDKYAEMEKKYLEELEELRQSSESRILVLEGSNRVEKEEQERSAKAALKDLQTKSQAELDELRSSTQSAYTELQQRSQAEYAELQQTSTDELAAVKKTLTSEMLSLKENAAANLAALADRSERQLQEHREHSNEALQQLKYFYAREREHLLEKATEEIARLQMFEIDQSSRREDRRCRETKALREELEVTKTEYCTQIKDLHRRYTSELEVLKATSKAEKKLLVQTHAEETESIRSAATRELSQTISSYEDRVHSMAVAHAAEVARNKEETAQAREDLVAKYESDLGSLQSERAREKDSLIFHYETELEALRQASRGEHDKNVKLHEAQVTQLREAHSSRILSLEMAMREQNKQTEDTLRQKDAQLESRRERIDVLEASEIALKERHEVQAERSLELVERTNMALSELESEIWRLDQLNLEKDAMLDSTNRVLKAGEEDLQTKATTILELTFVVKSRDDEIDKLRNALLDTVQTVNTKTEILELTTETLSSKAKELEATKNALRLESGKLSMVEESMSQKVGMLENSELKMESMRLNMENMRLEIKRMQMDMKLQLEHTEGEMELKNGEIRRLHGAQSELKQKNEFFANICSETGEVAQRRIELLRLETKQATEDTKKVCDELLDKEQELVIMTREKQAITAEKQRLQIQFNNLSQVNKTLQEKVELHTMQAEEIQCQYQKLLKERAAENDERMRSEKHLRMLELSAAKDTIRHLEGVEGRLSDTTSRLETVTNEKRHLRAEIKTLSEILEKYEDTDRQLDAANQEIQLKDKLLQDKTHELDALNKRLCKSEDEAQHFLDMSRMETEDWMSHFYRLTCSKDEMVCRNENLESILSNLRVEKEQLMLSLSQEKREIMRRAEDLQERIAGLRKEGAQAANEIKGEELEYLQENLGEQTTDTRKIKNTLDTLSIAHTELQAQFSSLSDQQQTETEENQKTVKSLQQHLESKAKQCESLQQSLNIQRQEIDLLMVQHDRDVMQLTDGHRSEAVQLIQSHRAQITQMTEDHLAQVSKLKEEHLSEVNLLTEERQSLTEEHHSGITRLKEVHQAEIDRLEGDLRYQVSALTVDRLSLITEQTEMHRTEVEGLIRDHAKEVETLTKSHRVEIAQKAEDYETEVTRLTAGNRSEIVRLREDHGNEVARLVEGINMNHKAESVQLEGDQPRNWLNLAADEQIRAVCAHSLELMTLHVAHQHEIELLELHATTTKQHITNQLIEQFSQLAAEHTQTLEVLESVHYQTATLADHSKVMDEHSASLATVRGELSEKSHALKNAEDVVTALNAKISELQAQLQATKYDAPGGTIDNVCNKKLDWGASEDLNDFSSQEAADFIQRCKNALELPGDDGTLMLDDIVEYIEQLMKILQHFELLQPKLGSPRRQPSATDPPPTLKSKVAAVLTFVEELQLITDFAQNILSDESKSEGDPGATKAADRVSRRYEY